MAVESNIEKVIADIAVCSSMDRLAKPIDVGKLFASIGSDGSSFFTDYYR